MLKALGRYLYQVFGQIDQDGIDVDETFNVLSGGQKGVTVSMRAAVGAGYTAAGRTGRRIFGWCVFCRFLNIVQPRHCALQFSSAPSGWSTWVRAGLAFFWGVFSLFHLWSLGVDVALFAWFATQELISRRRK